MREEETSERELNNISRRHSVVFNGISEELRAWWSSTCRWSQSFRCAGLLEDMIKTELPPLQTLHLKELKSGKAVG